MLKFIGIVLALLLLCACSTPRMYVPDSLRESTSTFAVQGRDGWKINQTIRFGGFEAGPVKRGWTKGYDYPFLVRFSGASEKFQFPIRQSGGGELQVFCLGRLREQDLLVFKAYFDLNLRTRDTFTCSAYDQGEMRYEFYATHLNVQQNPGYKAVAGSLKGAAQGFELHSVWQLESGQRSLGTEPMGYEFARAGLVVGAVETVNAGRVWLTNSLDAADSLAISAAASALMLRSSLADHNE